MSDITCPVCKKIGKYCVVRSFQINLDEYLVNCENVECSFPFGYDDSISLIQTTSQVTVCKEDNHVRNPSPTLDISDLLEMKDTDNCLIANNSSTIDSQYLDDVNFWLDNSMEFLGDASDNVEEGESTCQTEDTVCPPNSNHNSICPKVLSNKHIIGVDINSKPSTVQSMHRTSVTLKDVATKPNKCEKKQFQVVFMEGDNTSPSDVVCKTSSKSTTATNSLVADVIQIKIMDSSVSEMTDNNHTADKYSRVDSPVMKHSLYNFNAMPLKLIESKPKEMIPAAEKTKRPRILLSMLRF